MSKGMPTTATSARPPVSSIRGNRAKVAGPAYRGMREESTGPRGPGVAEGLVVGWSLLVIRTSVGSGGRSAVGRS
ncbi:hypothetical protein [Streptomyces albus]|uniref:hypothetical protein n=1 Tax=Streptomyces albus TaxID=1888 RepID=UPI0024E0B7E4|nr:hypothetical protein [Streptomyces albus]GHJ18890.1 hypothetical protein TPA0909_05040 [Streptomyces albus]GHJ18904.1 hypothetical protein TPA0909_05180 [Streptomyces albus]